VIALLVRIYTTLFELIFGLFFFVLLNKSLPTANVNEIGVVNPLEKLLSKTLKIFARNTSIFS